MSTNLGNARVTEAEYLAWEEAQEGRNEFVNGEVLAMAGVSDAHSALTVNLVAALVNRLRGGPCRVRDQGLRVRIDETRLYAYPDLTLVCGEAKFAPTRPVSLTNPTVIIEVLSPSTRDYDLGAKAAHYRHCPSVRTILFVDSQAVMVQRQDRNPNGTWTLAEQTEGEVSVLDLQIPIEEIYRDVELDPPDAPSGLLRGGHGRQGRRRATDTN